jgi:general stress protein 26
MGIELTDPEIDAYLAQAPTVILGIDRDGRAPLLVPMWFAWHEGALYMNTALDSAKIGWLRRRPEVSCLVESGDAYFTLKAVRITGNCAINDSQAEVNSAVWIEWLFQVKPLYATLADREQMPPHLERFYRRPRATLKVTPRRIGSWDFAKIRR